MAAIDPRYMTCTAYFYPSIVAGQAGEKVGGTGFFVGFPSPDGSHSYYPYIVTNRHVIDAGCRFLRIGMKDGSSLVDEVPLELWTFADDDDLAVAAIALPEGHDVLPFAPDLFIDESCAIDGWKVLPGDDVMFYGRFVAHDGRQKNRPVLRFGNVAMLADPDTPIDFGVRQQLAFLVECRSVSGFSGAPAFVQLAQSRLVHPDNSSGLEAKWIPQGAKFLGVNCGHLPFYSPARDRPSVGGNRLPNVWSETNSGIAVVIPAWRLLALLVREELSAKRERIWSGAGAS